MNTPADEELVNDLRCKLFHYEDEEDVSKIINEFLDANPGMLEIHDREWYHDWL